MSIILQITNIQFIGIKNILKLIGNNQEQLFPYKLNLEKNEKNKIFQIKILCKGNIDNFVFTSEKMKLCKNEIFHVKAEDIQKKLNNIFVKNSTRKIDDFLIIKYSIYTEKKIIFDFEQRIEKKKIFLF